MQQFCSCRTPNFLTSSTQLEVWDDVVVTCQSNQCILFWNFDKQSKQFIKTNTINVPFCRKFLVWRVDKSDIDEDTVFDDPSYLVVWKTIKRMDGISVWNKKGEKVMEYKGFNQDYLIDNIRFSRWYLLGNQLVFTAENLPFAVYWIPNGLDHMSSSGVESTYDPSNQAIPIPSQAQLWDFVQKGLRITDFVSEQNFKVDLEKKLGATLMSDQSVIDSDQDDFQQSDNEYLTDDEEHDIYHSYWKHPCACEWNGMVVTGTWKDTIYLWTCSSGVSSISYVGNIKPNSGEVTNLFSWRNYLCVEREDSGKTFLDFYCWSVTSFKSIHVYTLETERYRVLACGNFLYEFHPEEVIVRWSKQIFFGTDFVVVIPWEVKKQILIGWKKHTQEECLLAKLPKEILVYIMRLAGDVGFIAAAKHEKPNTVLNYLKRKRIE